MSSKVSIVRCNSYTYAEVYQAIKVGIDLLGGASLFVKPDERILLKVNLLAGDPPDKCVTTHPVVLKAVAQLFGEAGAKMLYGDSPSFGSFRTAAKKSAFTPVADEMGIEPANFSEGKEVFFGKGIQNKKFFVAKGVLDVDGMISLPKMKTHGLERFTGCIKNQFGCIVGIGKGEFHMKLPDPNEFARMLVDLNTFINPRLYIMDGIRAMEGNGPRSGNPRAMNVLLFSTDPVALDATACRMINMNPVFVPTTLFGYESGAGKYLENEIELLGDKMDEFYTPAFKIDRTPVKPYKKNVLLPLLNNNLVARPVIIQKKCNQCGICVDNCPVDDKAVNWMNGNETLAPVYDYSKCIRCYCCQEMCPEQAIVLKYPVLRRIMNTFAS